MAGTRTAAAPAVRPLLGIVLLILSTWTLSGLDASGKWIMAAGVPVLIVTWFRYAVHFVLVLALIVPTRGARSLKSKVPRQQIIRGGFMFFSSLSMFTTLTYLPQAEQTAINFLAPMLVLSLAPWLLKEPPRLSRWVAAGVAFAGVLIIIRPTSGLNPIGTCFGLLTAMLLGGQFLANRKIAIDNPFTSLAWSGAIGTLGSSILLPFFLPDAMSALSQFDVFHWLILAATGVTGALGHLLQIAAYRNAPASTLAPFLYLQIVSAAVFGWLIWGHFPDALTWLGICIICLSGVAIAIVEWRRVHPVPCPSLTL